MPRYKTRFIVNETERKATVKADNQTEAYGKLTRVCVSAFPNTKIVVLEVAKENSRTENKTLTKLRNIFKI